MSNEFDNIPEREELPQTALGEGFGVSETGLPTQKPADIVDMPIGVIGFLIMDNKFKETEKDPDKVVLYECLDASDNKFVFWHTSAVLKRQVTQRWEREEIPYRTVLEKVPSKKAGHQPYYSFA